MVDQYVKNIAIIFNENGYAGREYLSALNKVGYSDIDILLTGHYPELNYAEELRCGNLWTPPAFSIVSKGHNVYRFKSVNDIALLSFIKEKKYEVIIQAGTGIMKRQFLDNVKLGVLNFHPGDLPMFRGCSAPEYQIKEHRPVICTCHIVDEGIDSGDILSKKKLNLNYSSYYEMRASLYPCISEFVCEVIRGLRYNFNEALIKQDARKAKYRKYIGDDAIDELINNWQVYKDGLNCLEY